MPKASFHRAPSMNVYDILLGEHDVTEYFKMQEALLMLAGLGVGWGNTTIPSYA